MILFLLAYLGGGQMDAAEGAREESQRLTVLPLNYGMLVH